MGKIESKIHYFVDESWDPTFYNKYGTYIVGSEGCSKILILGLIRTDNPKALRTALAQLKNEIAEDTYLSGVPSITKTLKSFHAKDDVAEVRQKVYSLLKTLDFKAEFIVARKREDVFIKRHKKTESVFYNDLVSKLFENKLHKHEQNIIYYATRANKQRQKPFDDAIRTAINSFEAKCKQEVNSGVVIYPQTPSDEPCLQIIDYMNWAVFRAFTRGEDRFLKFMDTKISYLVDIYDFDKYPKNFYNKQNKFDVNKISPV